MKQGIAAEVLYSVVDLSTDSTTVYAGPCLYVGAYCVTALSAHVTVIKDGTTSVFQIPASAPMGNWYEGAYTRMATSLVVDPDNSGSGTLTVLYIPNHEGLVVAR